MKRRSIAAAVGALRLPADVDTAQFIREVERIAAITRESLGLEIEQHRGLAQLYAKTHRSLAAAPEDPWSDKAAIIEGLARWEDDCKRRADFLAGHLPRWRTWKFMELLILARGAGLDLSYTTQPPSGPGDRCRFLREGVESYEHRSSGARETVSAEADAKWVREREAAAAAGIRRKLPQQH